jgi:hypothetical protein
MYHLPFNSYSFSWLKVAAIWQFLSISNVHSRWSSEWENLQLFCLKHYARQMNRKRERKKNACGNRSINTTCSSALSSENRWSVDSTLTSTKSARIIHRTRASISHLSCKTSYSSYLSLSFFFLLPRKRDRKQFLLIFFLLHQR